MIRINNLKMYINSTAHLPIFQGLSQTCADAKYHFLIQLKEIHYNNYTNILYKKNTVRFKGKHYPLCTAVPKNEISTVF